MKLIACEVLYREACAAIARSPNRVDVEFMPHGLHGLGAERMLERLQETIDRPADISYDAVLLGYGLCGTGLIRLEARKTKVILPRAHDCMTFFLGSKERYREYFDTHPGVYFRTTGWLERFGPEDTTTQLAPVDMASAGMSYEDLVKKFGEEDAKYIMDELSPKPKHYGQITFIEMGLEPDGSFEKRARAEADEKSWKFEKVRGDLSLVQALVDGPWDEDRFLVLEPGMRVVHSYSETIVKAAKAG